ncbi:MAG TPA: hypothetical protein VNT20_13765 [Flavisolibacter sp.]|jgi:hypothetical protein|nr:hypothetical protein [Flavisolibacter sp.]
MKNTIALFVAALFFTAAVNAQSTVDSIHAKYQMQPMPEALTIEKTFPVTGTYQLNSLNSADSSSAQQVTITLDSSNKGIIWIAGLPEGTMKAYLKKSPGTYRIISQKSESGKQIPEGTLFFDPSTNTLNVALGKTYDEADPTAIFANANTATDNMDVADNSTTVKTKTKTPAGKTKAKNKLVFYTATKNVMTSTDVNAAKQ